MHFFSECGTCFFSPNLTWTSDQFYSWEIPANSEALVWSDGPISRSLTCQNGMFHSFHCVCLTYPCGKEPVENVWKGEDVLENKNLEGNWMNALSAKSKTGSLLVKAKSVAVESFSLKGSWLVQPYSDRTSRSHPAFLWCQPFQWASRDPEGKATSLSRRPPTARTHDGLSRSSDVRGKQAVSPNQPSTLVQIKPLKTP